MVGGVRGALVWSCSKVVNLKSYNVRFRLYLNYVSSHFKVPHDDFRQKETSPAQLPLVYEPHRSSGAGRSPCLQAILVVSFTAPSAVTRTPSSLCRSGNLSSLAGTLAAQAITTAMCSSPSRVSLCPCSQGPACSRRVGSSEVPHRNRCRGRSRPRSGGTAR